MRDPKTKVVNCPHCGQPAPYGPENRFRPFCSERCKMIDLGHWAAEDYRIAGVPEPAAASPEDTSN